MYGRPHGGAEDADYCSERMNAASIDATWAVTPNVLAFSIIVLCDLALVEGDSPDSTGSQSGIEAIAALTGNAGLYYNKLIDNVVYTSCLSFFLLHEMFHLTQDHWCELKVEV